MSRMSRCTPLLNGNPGTVGGVSKRMKTSQTALEVLACVWLQTPRPGVTWPGRNAWELITSVSVPPRAYDTRAEKEGSGAPVWQIIGLICTRHVPCNVPSLFDWAAAFPPKD